MNLVATADVTALETAVTDANARIDGVVAWNSFFLAL